jgi:glycosyltransferase involved in cell wall biosynthesis
MDQKMLVSIIINNHNYASYVGAAIKSALDQEYGLLEVIVVDDGSTDDSSQVLSCFSDRTELIFKKNEGQASAFNAGYERSHGNIVIFLDADDLLAPTAATTAVQFMALNGFVKVHWPLWEIDHNGVRTGNLVPRQDLARGYLREEVIEHGRIDANHSPTSGNAWARHFLDQVFPIEENGDRHGADGVLRLLAPIYGAIERVGEPQGSYRVHSGNFSGGRGTLFCVERDFRRSAYYFPILARHLSKLGIPFDTSKWTGPASYHAWIGRILKARREIVDVLSPYTCVILVDQCDMGADLLPNYDIVPFIERDGTYWGPPQDDCQAIHELERLQKDGAQFLTFIFSTFWWFDRYPNFSALLRSRFECIHENEDVIIFKIGD